LGISILFTQVEDMRGWDFASTLAVLGVYLTLSALRSLFMSPSFDALAGMDGEVWLGTLDFTLLRPVDTQFLASFRQWRLFALFDLLLGLGVQRPVSNGALPGRHLPRRAAVGPHLDCPGRRDDDYPGPRPDRRSARRTVGWQPGLCGSIGRRRVHSVSDRTAPLRQRIELKI